MPRLFKSKFTENGFTKNKVYNGDHLIDDHGKHRAVVEMFLTQWSYYKRSFWAERFKEVTFDTYVKQIEKWDKD